MSSLAGTLTLKQVGGPAWNQVQEQVLGCFLLAAEQMHA